MSDSRNQPPVPSSWSDADDRLDSWKEIASYLQRTLATVRRWEKKEGLPVHRHLHEERGTVYAYRSEIDTWLANRSKVLENDRPGWFRFVSENKKTVAGVAGIPQQIYVDCGRPKQGICGQKRTQDLSQGLVSIALRQIFGYFVVPGQSKPPLS